MGSDNLTIWTVWHTSCAIKLPFSLLNLPRSPLYWFYYLICFNFHNSSNSPSHFSLPPTHQQWVAQCRLFPQLSAEKSADPDSRPEDQGPFERHMYHFLFSAPIKEDMEAAEVYLWRQNHAQRHTHAHISVCLIDRDGGLHPTPNPTDGYHASGKEQVWTAQWQLLPKQREMRGEKTQIKSFVYQRMWSNRDKDGGREKREEKQINSTQSSGTTNLEK